MPFRGVGYQAVSLLSQSWKSYHCCSGVNGKIPQILGTYHVPVAVIGQVAIYLDLKGFSAGAGTGLGNARQYRSKNLGSFRILDRLGLVAEEGLIHGVDDQPSVADACLTGDTLQHDYAP